MSYLTLDGVSHYYFSKKQYTESLHNISFSVKKNEFVALLGPSGCGKSTLLSMISGMLQPAEGEILINNEKIEIKRFRNWLYAAAGLFISMENHYR